jgi:hypothetical protein
MLTRAARLYALRELARRAGVEFSFFRTWSVDVQSECTVVSFSQNPGASITFVHAREEWWSCENGKQVPVGRACWMRHPGDVLATRIPDFVLPFIDPIASGPLFRVVSPGQIRCEVDLLASILFSLCRVEEERNPDRDAHGRFPAQSSSAFRHGYFARPIVDEYGFAFEQALIQILPSWRPRPRRLRIKLSHDVDSAGIPFKLRTTIGHTIRRHAPGATLKNLGSCFLGTLPSCLSATLKLVDLSRRYGVRSAVYWKASPPGPFDSGYDPHDARISGVIASLTNAGVEQGAHPGFSTFGNFESLAQEVQIVREVLGHVHLGGRQHYLRWSPATWSAWERCGLLYDSSVGYSGLVGFRAGTAYPYRPWLLREDREAALVEIPLIAMDISLSEGLGLRGEDCLLPLESAIRRCELVGGVFAVLWHNDSLLVSSFGNTYERLLSLLANHPDYEIEPYHLSPACAELP